MRGEAATTAVFALGALLCVIAALLLGSVSIAPVDVVASLFGGGGALEREIVRELRLPRVLGGFCCGALLALAGTLPGYVREGKQGSAVRAWRLRHNHGRSAGGRRGRCPRFR